MRAQAHAHRSISSGPDVRATVFWCPCYRSNPAILKGNCRAARPENFARRQNLRREGLIRVRRGLSSRQYLFDLPKQLLRCLPRGHEPIFDDVRIGQR